jgi:hypothetical protein
MGAFSFMSLFLKKSNSRLKYGTDKKIVLYEGSPESSSGQATHKGQAALSVASFFGGG